MSFPIKKLLFTFAFNSSLFLLLLIGIQNSSSRKKVDFIINETIRLPISFIVGGSFITGSLTGGLLNLVDFKR
tara:strand:+ start:197 stop:415 length:219 start_codon:yes stop_codon:yes gene_type:complete